MVGVPLPKGEFLPHPKGQHEGTIFDVEIRLNEATQYGPKNRVILKIESDTIMKDENDVPIKDEEGNERGWVIWDWLTVARKQGSRFRDRREAILGRPLSEAEIKANEMDPHTEFAGKKISYVVKHAPGKDPGVIYANIDSMWITDPVDYNPQAPAPEVLTKQITELETLVGLTAEEVKGLRDKYLGGSSLEVDNKTASEYIEVLSKNVPATAVSDDGLPF